MRENHRFISDASTHSFVGHLKRAAPQHFEHGRKLVRCDPLHSVGVP